MKFLQPEFWKNKNFLSIILFPFSILFSVIVSLKKNIIYSKKFNIPIICIGNIYVGGTGKTPLSMLINNELIKKQKRPIIIKKYYKDHEDEHKLIKAKTNNLILKNKRVEAVSKAVKENFDVVILDDGFQDYSITKNLNIICFNSKQLLGNGLMFPSGPLRENISSLKDVQIVIINGDKVLEFENQILQISKNIKIYYSKYIPANIDQFKGKKLLAFAGIGNPSNFFDLLTKNNLNICKTFSYPDHYKFTKFDLDKISSEAKKNNCEIITTEKDYYRIKDSRKEYFKYLKVDLEISEKEKLINQILNYL